MNGYKPNVILTIMYQVRSDAEAWRSYFSAVVALKGEDRSHMSAAAALKCDEVVTTYFHPT